MSNPKHDIASSGDSLNEEDSKHHETSIVQEVKTKSQNECNRDGSIEEVEVKEGQSEAAVVKKDSENVFLQENFANEGHKSNDLDHIEEKKNSNLRRIIPNITFSEIMDDHQHDVTLSASALEGSTSEYSILTSGSLSGEDEIRSYDTTNLTCTDEKVFENELRDLDEQSRLKNDVAVSQNAQVSLCVLENQNQGFEADSQTQTVQNEASSTEVSIEVTANTDPNKSADEQIEALSTDSNISEVQNNEINTEEPVGAKEYTVDKYTNCLVDEQNQNQGFEAVSHTQTVQNATSSYEDAIQVTVKTDPNKSADEQIKVLSTDSNMSEVKNNETNTEEPVGATDETVDKDAKCSVGEQSKDSSAVSKMPQVQNAATSTEEPVGATDEIVDKDAKCSVDEHAQSKDSSTASKLPQVQNAATSTDVPVSENKSPNGKKLAAKHSRRSSEEVTEIISKYLNSEGYIKKLDKIDEIVKQLTSVEFLSAELANEDLSPEDLEALKEIYSQQLEKMATKRKSKLSESDEDSEDLQATSKKCKLSNTKDGTFNIEGWETSCCLEEQFRVAFQETSDDQSGKNKEYKFPLTTGEDQPRKFCKHQIAKIDAMVASVMSLDSYLNQLSSEEPDKSNDSTAEVSEDTPCCYHSKAQRSNLRLSKNKIASKKSVSQKMIADSMEESSESSDKSKLLSLLSFEGALNSIKNFFLFVSFTGSLIVAMTVGKVLGIPFPAGKSKRNITRGDSQREFHSL